MVAAKKQGEEDDGAEVGQKSEVVMKKPQEARATPRPEHLLCSSNSTTYHLPMLSTSVVVSEIHQTLKKVLIARTIINKYRIIHNIHFLLETNLQK